MLRIIKKTLFLILVCIFYICPSLNARPVIIAHRGASGYLPEHTLASKAMAYALRPDYIEQDVVATRDGHLIVLHDHHLDQVTDVAHKYPHRHRADGRFYAIDFDLAEIKQLQVQERFNRHTQKRFFAQRFPQTSIPFRISTLAEEIELIQGLNQTLGYQIGLYVEIKSPEFHQNEGFDISRAVLTTLKHYGYQAKTSNIYLQCFHAHELRRITQDLMPQLNMDLKTILLMYYDDPQNFTPPDLAQIKTYADGIGINQAYLDTTVFASQPIHMVQRAHQYQLQVHVYTHRSDAPHREGLNLKLWIHHLVQTVGVDGFFTDFVDDMTNLLP